MKNSQERFEKHSHEHGAFQVKEKAYMSGSTRKRDMEIESITSQFKDKHLYDEISRSNPGISFRRVTNKDEQCSGKDVVMVEKGVETYIDEKDRAHAINKAGPTFSFEISGLVTKKGTDPARHRETTHSLMPSDNQMVNEGWFISDAIKTNLYSVSYLFGKTDEDTLLKIDKGNGEKTDEYIEKMYILLLDKKKMMVYLENRGITKEFMKDFADKARRDPAYQAAFSDGDEEKKPLKVLTVDPHIHFSISNPNKYPEAPINIVIDFDALKYMAVAEYIVTNKGYEEIKEPWNMKKPPVIKDEKAVRPKEGRHSPSSLLGKMIEHGDDQVGQPSEGFSNTIHITEDIQSQIDRNPGQDAI